MTLDEVFVHISPLTTSRLVIRPMEMKDVQAMYEIKSDFDVTKQYGSNPHTTLDETSEWVKQRLENYESGKVIFFVFDYKENMKTIGSCCFWNLDKESLRAEIGYELNRAYWNKGLMSEALRAIITFGFKEAGFHRIEANPLSINKASMKVLSKLGFKNEGTLRDRVMFQEKFVDQIYYGLLADEWK